jgi:hypothetical protein
MYGIILKEYKYSHPGITHLCVLVLLKRVENEVHYA